MSDKKRNLLVMGVCLFIIFNLLACSNNLATPTIESDYVTQTFSAFGTEVAIDLLGQMTTPAEINVIPAISTDSALRSLELDPPTPPEPPADWEYFIYDENEASLPTTHRANGGENFGNDIFERPFTAYTMEYLPDIDIVAAALARSEEWVFVNLTMGGSNKAGGMQGIYGIELDCDMDGRGDFIIFGEAPISTEWSTDGVKAYEDIFNDVGGDMPLVSDDHPGNGYDMLIFDEGSNFEQYAAWVRISPDSAYTVQLAFNYSLFSKSSKYLWSVWVAVPEVLNPTWFDYNDYFTHPFAGSPLSESLMYPLKALYGWDNTCRWVAGIKKPVGTEKGLCADTSQSTQAPMITITPSPTKGLKPTEEPEEPVVPEPTVAPPEPTDVPPEPTDVPPEPTAEPYP